MEVARYYTLLTMLTLFTPLYMCAYIYQHLCRYILLGKLRTLLELANELLSKKWEWMDGLDWTGFY